MSCSSNSLLYILLKNKLLLIYPLDLCSKYCNFIRYIKDGIMVSDHTKSKEQLICELQDMRCSYERLRIECSEDVAKLREAEVALRVSESKYRLLAQNSSDVIWDSG